MTDEDFIKTLEPDEEAYIRAVRTAIKEQMPDGLKHLVSAILIDGEIVPTDMITASLWSFRNPDNIIVAKDEIGDNEVSTVFLTTPRERSGENYHFETMVFGLGTVEGIYKTLADAQKGHKQVCEKLRKKL